VQVTEGDGYYLGRVLINAQIAAALTVRLRPGCFFYGYAYGCPKNELLRVVDEGTLWERCWWRQRCH
jgi:hypothetical protein